MFTRMHFLHPIIATLFGLLCFGAALWSSWNAPRSTQMAFVVLAFVFFLVYYLAYFYHLANFSPQACAHERHQLQHPPPVSLRRILTLGLLGLFWLLLLVALLCWRTF